jgi:hypothetical protein
MPNKWRPRSTTVRWWIWILNLLAKLGQMARSRWFRLPPTPRAWRSLVPGTTGRSVSPGNADRPAWDRISASGAAAIAVGRLPEAELPQGPTTCAGAHCPDLPAFFRASPRPSVAALGLHGFTIRIRVSRAGVDWRMIRLRVQDRVAARRVFTRPRHSGLSTRRAHNVVVGFLCADSVGLRLVIPPRCTGGSKLLVKPVRRLNMCDSTRRSGGWYGWLLNTPSDQRDCDGGQCEDNPHSVSLVTPPAAGIIIFSPLVISPRRRVWTSSGIVTLISRGRHEAEGRRYVDLHAY